MVGAHGGTLWRWCDRTRRTGRRRPRSRPPSGAPAFALPGTLVERRIRCGKPGCRCAADDPAGLHGPYYQWTRKVNGKTVTRLLSAAQMERYRDWFANARRIRDLTGELEALSLEIAASTEDWG